MSLFKKENYQSRSENDEHFQVEKEINKIDVDIVGANEITISAKKEDSDTIEMDILGKLISDKIQNIAFAIIAVLAPSLIYAYIVQGISFMNLTAFMIMFVAIIYTSGGFFLTVYKEYKKIKHTMINHLFIGNFVYWFGWLIISLSVSFNEPLYLLKLLISATCLTIVMVIMQSISIGVISLCCYRFPHLISITLNGLFQLSIMIYISYVMWITKKFTLFFI